MGAAAKQAKGERGGWAENLFFFFYTRHFCFSWEKLPTQKKRTNSKRNFTEKIMPESESLGKRYKEKRCHLTGCND